MDQNSDTRHEMEAEQMETENEGMPNEMDDRAAMLLEQAEIIMESGGPNMLEVFQSDAVIHEKVVSGEWDFMIAYGFVLGREGVRRKTRGAVPAPVRNPNHANTRKSIASMSEKEFDELDERLARGEVVDPRQ